MTVKVNVVLENNNREPNVWSMVANMDGKEIFKARAPYLSVLLENTKGDLRKAVEDTLALRK